MADVVEAMSSHRPYRPAIGMEAALEEIEEGRGVRYDERVTDACLRVFREHDFAFRRGGDAGPAEAVTDAGAVPAGAGPAGRPRRPRGGDGDG